MNPRELGEFGLIEAIRRRAARDRRGASGWHVAIGDDAAAFVPKRGEELVATTDALVEDVHFRWRTTDPRSLGHKALAVNLSDVGAMGARPVGFLLTLGFPPRIAAARLDGFFRGLLKLARASRCPLVGGDIVRSPAFTATVTAFGAVPAGRLLLRRGARAGERLMLTGALGGAAAGLRLLEGPGARTRQSARSSGDRLRRIRPGAPAHGWSRRGCLARRSTSPTGSRRTSVTWRARAAWGRGSSSSHCRSRPASRVRPRGSGSIRSRSRSRAAKTMSCFSPSDGGDRAPRHCPVDSCVG